MIVFFIVALIVSVYEWLYMIKNNLKREKWLYLSAVMITLIFGYYYFSDPYRDSLSYIVLDFLNLKD